MHVAMVMVGGLIQLGVFLIFGWHWGTTPAAMATAAKLFLPVWLLVAAVNMWVGVAHAGYSVKEELPIDPVRQLPGAGHRRLAGGLAVVLARLAQPP